MSTTTGLVLQAPDRKARLRKLVWMVVLVVIGLHLAAGLVAGVFVVARYLMKPEPTFAATKDVRMPAKEREQKMNMAEFDSLAPKPSFNDKLQSLKPAKFSLPELPKIPLDQMVPLDPSAIVSDQVSSMVGAAGTGSGSGQGGSGMGGTGSGMSFFGIQDTGKSVVIVVDTSNSMFSRSFKGEEHRFKFQTIKDQTTQLIDKLSINTRFNVVIYEGGAMAFAGENMPATDGNKASAREWVQGLDEDPATSIGRRQGDGPKLMEGGGTRLDTAMKQTFKLQPEVIYIITDGEINRSGGRGREEDEDSKPRGGSRNERGEGNKITEREIVGLIEELQKGLPQPARIHTILYETHVTRTDEENAIRAIARRNEGKFRTVKAEETKD
jgi:hypothetical protein